MKLASNVSLRQVLQAGPWFHDYDQIPQSQISLLSWWITQEIFNPNQQKEK